MGWNVVCLDDVLLSHMLLHWSLYMFLIAIVDAFVTKEDPNVKYILKNAAIGAG